MLTFGPPTVSCCQGDPDALNFAQKQRGDWPPIGWAVLVMSLTAPLSKIPLLDLSGAVFSSSCAGPCSFPRPKWAPLLLCWTSSPLGFYLDGRLGGGPGSALCGAASKPVTRPLGLATRVWGRGSAAAPLPLCLPWPSGQRVVLAKPAAPLASGWLPALALEVGPEKQRRLGRCLCVAFGFSVVNRCQSSGFSGYK